MRRYLLILYFLCYLTNTDAQNTATETVKRYSIAQKRLLLVSTAQFTELLMAGNVDRDSIQLIACRATGLPFLIAYADEPFSAGDSLINTGNIQKAVQLLQDLRGDSRIHHLITLATWYLHKAGTHKADLDSANRFINQAMLLSAEGKNNGIRYKCLDLLGEYYRQAGNEPESKKIYLKMVSSGQKESNKEIVAIALHHLGRLHSEIDSANLAYLNQSMVLFHELQLKEREMELLWDISTHHYRYDMNLLINDLKGILRLQQATGYKHSMFANYFLSLGDLNQGKYLEALDYSKAALENMKWSGMSAIEGTFYMRVGSVYARLGKDEEALSWYGKGLEHRSLDTHIFWFKSLLYAAAQLFYLNRTKEALALMENVTVEFPPITPWERAMIVTTQAACYRDLKKDAKADERYRTFLKIINDYPGINRFGEFGGDFRDGVDFYLARSDLKTAKLFAGKMGAGDNSLTSKYIRTVISYKLDSAVGNYKTALNHYIKYKVIDDSLKANSQRKQFEELALKYGEEKKDNEIKLLQKDKILQTSMLLQAKHTRNWILGAIALLLTIVGLLVYNSRIKQRTNRKLTSQQIEIGKQNNTLRHLVNEKDWLVKEIHHRVKNNFQMVMGLLGTQSAYLKNDIAVKAISDSQQRIQSMSLIHQRLYQSNNLSAIRMNDYVNELVNSFSDSFNTGNLVRFTLDIYPIELDLAYCIPLGLIMNEAITNSFKYAFPENKRGEIKISLKRIAENNFLLTINDNGLGLPPGFDPNQSNTMGWNLMRGLCAEIDGQFSIKNDNGTRIEIGFMYAATTYPEFVQMDKNSVYV